MARFVEGVKCVCLSHSGLYNLDTYRSPPSQIIVTIFLPGPSLRASFIAPTRFSAADGPMKRPSCFKTKYAISTASWSSPRIAPSSWLCLKLFVIRPMPMPSISLLPIAETLPEETYSNRTDPNGSIRKHFISGFCSLRYAEMPASVPPVPHEHTKASISPPR